MPDFSDLLQNVYDFFANRYRDAAGGSNFVVFEPCGQALSPADFKANPADSVYSPTVAGEHVSALVNTMVKVSTEILVETTMKLDDFYSLLLSGATPHATDSAALQFLVNLQAQAKRDFDDGVRASSSLGGADYHYALATPGDWYDESQATLWTPYAFSVSTPAARPTASPKLSTKPQMMMWKLNPDAAKVAQVLSSNRAGLARMSPQKLTALKTHLDTSAVPRTAARAPIAGRRPGAAVMPMVAAKRAPALTQVLADKANLSLVDRLRFRRTIDEIAPTQTVASNGFSISFKYCVVSIDRPWIFEPFLRHNDWYIPGKWSASYSTGSFDNNTGDFPAITTALIAIRDLKIDANWSTHDTSMLQEAVGIGPFALGSSYYDSQTQKQTLSHDGIQILGWVCQVLPVLPPQSDPTLP